MKNIVRINRSRVFIVCPNCGEVEYLGKAFNTRDIAELIYDEIEKEVV